MKETQDDDLKYEEVFCLRLCAYKRSYSKLLQALCTVRSLSLLKEQRRSLVLAIQSRYQRRMLVALVLSFPFVGLQWLLIDP
jgi:uncharacterized membrane protein